MAKLWNLCVLGLIAIASLGVTSNVDSEITDFLKHIGVLSEDTAVEEVNFLEVTYDSGAHVNRGSELTPTQVKNPPSVCWDTEENLFYTLTMIYSNQSDSERSQFHHWLVVNIHGDDVSSGDIISEYLSSGPSKGSGLYLYVFLLYKQPNHIEFEESNIDKYTVEGRGNFSVENFAAKYDLGLPVAANYFVAQYDDYVPIVHSQIGY